MPCRKYIDLEISYKSAQSRFAQYAYEQNRHLRGTSDTEAKRIVKQEKESMSTLSNEMFQHRENCPECKSHETLSMNAVYCDTDRCKASGHDKREIRVWFQPGESETQEIKCPYCGATIERTIAGRVKQIAGKIL